MHHAYPATPVSYSPSAGSRHHPAIRGVVDTILPRSFSCDCTNIATVSCSATALERQEAHTWRHRPEDRHPSDQIEAVCQVADFQRHNVLKGSGFEVQELCPGY